MLYIISLNWVRWLNSDSKSLPNCGNMLCNIVVAYLNTCRTFQSIVWPRYVINVKRLISMLTSVSHIQCCFEGRARLDIILPLHEMLNRIVTYIVIFHTGTSSHGHSKTAQFTITGISCGIEKENFKGHWTR